MRYILIILMVCAIIIGCNKSFKGDEYKIYETEGLIALIVAENTIVDNSIPQPDNPEPSECTCKGTGKVKTGDGLNTTQCPCGENCKCSKFSKRFIFLTSKNCSPCNKFKKTETKQLEKQGWTFGDKNCLFETIECNIKDSKFVTDRNDILNNYKVSLSEGLPMFLLIENNKLIEKHIGYITAKSLTDMYYKK